jgi:hypothetical protein
VARGEVFDGLAHHEPKLMHVGAAPRRERPLVKRRGPPSLGKEDGPTA